MARQKYDDAYGVLRMNWKRGSPELPWYGGAVVVEIWDAESRANMHEARMPQVRVSAVREVWVRNDGQWRAVRSNGTLSDIHPGEVRRHATVNAMRWWETTITIDGWK